MREGFGGGGREVGGQSGQSVMYGCETVLGQQGQMRSFRNKLTKARGSLRYAYQGGWSPTCRAEGKNADC